VHDVLKPSPNQAYKPKMYKNCLSHIPSNIQPPKLILNYHLNSVHWKMQMERIKNKIYNLMNTPKEGYPMGTFARNEIMKIYL
jgi:hypothetical protein